MPSCISLAIYSEPGIDSKMRDFCKQKVESYLASGGFEISIGQHTQLIVNIVEAVEVRKPVRSGKVRIMAKLSTGPTTVDVILIGVANGIVPRLDLDSGASMPNSSYLRAAQLAISKLMRQLSNFPQTYLF